MDENIFRAGAAKVDITPPLGTIINGDFVRHFARYIHDPLYAKALVLQNATTTLALVVVDICVMPKDFLDEVKAIITARTGIPAGQILLSSTHTHAAGSVAEVHLVGADLGYRSKLPNMIVASVVQALKKVRPARIAFGAVDVPEHVVCRRYYMTDGYKPYNPVNGESDIVKTNPVGVETSIIRRVAPTDPEVGFLAVQGTDGAWISLLANYSLHYVGDWADGTISADYFGVFASHIQQLLGAGDEFVGIMSNGTSGDVNIWDFMEPGRYPAEHFQKSQLIGSDIAQRVHLATKDLIWQEQPELGVLYEEIPLTVNKPTTDELSTAREVVMNSNYENLLHVDEVGLRSIYAREQVLLNEFPDIVHCPVQALRIGDGLIGGLPGEFFAETGLWLKEHVRSQHYFTISLANGNVGYVPPSHEISRGGYETWRCRISCLKSDSESKIREALLHLTKHITTYSTANK